MKKFIAFRDTTDTEVILNVGAIKAAAWVQLQGRDEKGQPVPILGPRSRTVVITAAELHQATTVHRYVHPDCAQAVWDCLMQEADDFARCKLPQIAQPD